MSQTYKVIIIYNLLMANSQPIECLANDMTSPTTHLPTNICYIGGLFIDFFGLLADNLSSLYVA